MGTVFVSGLSRDDMESVVRQKFEKCGVVDRVNLVRNSKGNPKGAALIQFQTEEGLAAALKWDGKKLQVSRAVQAGGRKRKDREDEKKASKDEAADKPRKKTKTKAASAEEQAAPANDDSEAKPRKKKAKTSAPTSE